MIYLAIVSLIWAFSFGIIGSSLAGVDSFLVATIRLACASLLFFPFLRLKQISGKDCIRLFCYGSVQFGLMYVFYMKAFQFLPSHLVALFSILTPVYVVLIHDIRSQQWSIRYFLAALLSVIGAATIKIQGLPSGDFWIGFTLMQLAGISFAFGQIAYRDWKLKHFSTPNTAIFSIISLGGMTTAGIFTVLFANPEKLSINALEWQSILYLGFIASGLGFFLWNKGASITNPGTLAAFNNAVVPLAMLFSLFIFGEFSSVSFESLVRLMLGGLLIGIAVSISTTRKD